MEEREINNKCAINSHLRAVSVQMEVLTLNRRYRMCVKIQKEIIISSNHQQGMKNKFDSAQI